MTNVCFKGPARRLCPRDVRETFHIPLRQAADALGVTDLCLKRMINRSIPCWPYRKFKKLRNLRRAIIDHPGQEADQSKAMVDLILREAERLQADPGHKLCSEITKYAEAMSQSDSAAALDDDNVDPKFWGEWAKQQERKREKREGPAVSRRWVHKIAAPAQRAAPTSAYITPSQGTAQTVPGIAELWNHNPVQMSVEQGIAEQERMLHQTQAQQLQAQEMLGLQGAGGSGAGPTPASASSPTTPLPSSAVMSSSNLAAPTPASLFAEELQLFSQLSLNGTQLIYQHAQGLGRLLTHMGGLHLH